MKWIVLGLAVAAITAAAIRHVNPMWGLIAFGCAALILILEDR